MGENVVKGYLDIKILSKSRRGFTPWKAWQRQWCEISRLDDIANGAKLTFKSNVDGNVLNCIKLPRSATLCRSDSRTKPYAFGVFNLYKNKKPLVFLSGISESESQDWMMSIRKMLSIARYIPVGDTSFRISLVDNNHSRKAGLLGLFGVLSVKPQEIVVSDPSTGSIKIAWRWYNFHQFHMQAPLHPADDKRIVVMHTSRDFIAGPGQLYLYCREGSQLLHELISRGTYHRISNGLNSSKRFSKSEGDLCSTKSSYPDSPICFRSQAGSDDSGVPGSQGSDKGEVRVESVSMHFGISAITKTPGGSETEDSCPDLLSNEFDTVSGTRKLPRNESGISLASGIYEEISESDDTIGPKGEKPFSHVYENPIDMIFDEKVGKQFRPPPLPPRTMTLDRRKTKHFYYTPVKQRCNTLPAKDLSKLSQIFNSDSEYVIMSPVATLQRPKKQTVSEGNNFPNYYNFPENAFFENAEDGKHTDTTDIYLPMSRESTNVIEDDKTIYLPMSHPTDSLVVISQNAENNIYLPMSPQVKLPLKISE